MYLNKLLEEIFQDKEIPLTLLSKYGLESVVDKAVLSIKNVLENPPITTHRLIGLAPTILVLINSNLKTITNIADKQKLEHLIAEVAGHLFKKLIDISDQPSTALREIKISLQTASELNGYNLDVLLSLLKYEHLESTYNGDATFWYEWTGKPHELDELARKLKNQDFIKSVKDFKKLFEPHDMPSIRVQFSKDSLHFLIALFDELKDRKLIIPKGCNGHFHPLRVYGIDFERNNLMNTEPKSIKNIAKRNPEKWKKLQNRAKEWVADIKPPVTSKLP